MGSLVGDGFVFVERPRVVGQAEVGTLQFISDVMETGSVGFSCRQSAMLDESDLHVHVPAGAVPKDGPSAGIAMFTALASLFSNRSVSKEVAMTGEVTLRGLVPPIGGLKEKSIAALRAGIKTIIIPKLNEKDIGDLPDEVRQKLRIVLVETVDEVLAEALVPGAAAAAPHHSGLTHATGVPDRADSTVCAA